MSPRDCLEHCVASSGDLDSHGTRIEAASHAFHQNNVRADDTGNGAQYLFEHFLQIHPRSMHEVRPLTYRPTMPLSVRQATLPSTPGQTQTGNAVVVLRRRVSAVSK